MIAGILSPEFTNPTTAICVGCEREFVAYTGVTFRINGREYPMCAPCISESAVDMAKFEGAARSSAEADNGR